MKIRSILPPAGSHPLVLSDFLNTFGTGLFVTGGTLFFTRGTGLSIAQTSTILTVAGIFAIMWTIPVGHLADVRGPKRVTVVLFAIRSVGILSFLTGRNVLALGASACVVVACDRALQGAFGALVAAVSGAEKLRVQAYLRSVTNVALTVGSLAASPFLVINTTESYFALILCYGLTQILAGAALLAARIPASPITRRARPWALMRDRPYLTVAAIHAVLALQFEVLAFALPLWVVYSVGVPAWLIPLLLGTNTAIVAVFQVRASSVAATVSSASTWGRRSGIAFLLSCALFSLAAHLSVAVAVSVLVMGVVVHSVGELWQAAASFTHSYELADQSAHGQYQGMFAFARAAQRAVAPFVLGLLCFRIGQIGWILLGAVLLFAGLVLGPAVRRAERMHGGMTAILVRPDLEAG